MRSWKFPDMLSGNSSAIWKESEHKESTKQNAKLLLYSEKNSTLGDPYIGVNRLLFEQNSPVLQDIAADNIYTQLALFLPQIKLNREDIKIIRSNAYGKVTCTFSGINQIDYNLNTYSLTIFSENEDRNI